MNKKIPVAIQTAINSLLADRNAIRELFKTELNEDKKDEVIKEYHQRQKVYIYYAVLETYPEIANLLKIKE